MAGNETRNKKTNTARKTATKRVAAGVSKRKAPTSVASSRASQKKTNSKILIAVGVFIVCIGASVAIGFAGEGQISLTETFAERKLGASPEEVKRIESIPVKKSSVREGGLVQTSSVEEQPVVVVKPEIIASSTEDTASSTDSVLEDNTNNTNNTNDPDESEIDVSEPQSEPTDEGTTEAEG